MHEELLQSGQGMESRGTVGVTAPMDRRMRPLGRAAGDLRTVTPTVGLANAMLRTRARNLRGLIQSDERAGSRGIASVRRHALRPRPSLPAPQSERRGNELLPSLHAELCVAVLCERCDRGARDTEFTANVGK